MVSGPFSPLEPCAFTGEIPKHVPVATEGLWTHLVLAGLMHWFSTGANFFLLEDILVVTFGGGVGTLLASAEWRGQGSCQTP